MLHRVSCTNGDPHENTISSMANSQRDKIKFIYISREKIIFLLYHRNNRFSLSSTTLLFYFQTTEAIK